MKKYSGAPINPIKTIIIIQIIFWVWSASFVAQSMSIHIQNPRSPSGAVPDILGLKGTAARVIIRRALDEELVRSSSEKGPLSIAFPHKVLDAWFPQLFTDLPVQEPHGNG